MIRKSLVPVLVVLAVSPAFAGGSKKDKNNNNGSPSTTAPAAQSRDDAAVEFLVTLDGTKFKLSDDDSVAAIHKLQGFWKDTEVTSGTKSKIPGTLYWFAQRKSSVVSLAAIGALGDLGKGAGTQKLVMLLDGMMMQKDPPADQVAAVLASFKNAADPGPGVTAAIMKVLDAPNAATAAKAADVFANYAGAPLEVRKALFEQMLVKFELMAAAAAKPENKPAVDRWATLSGPALGALNGITKQSFADVPAARKWQAEKSADPAAWK